ncbi:MAG: protein kinase, partial [Akkermansiaceae bacterium]
QIMGSPLYMAPEQAAGETNNLTTAADIYSLGAILYELLSGQPPFQGDTILETLRKAREEEAPRLSTISAVDRDLETITTKCLEKNPAARYSTANDLADDLENWLEGRPINARPITSVERTIKWVKRKPVVATLWAVAALFIFTLGIGGPIVAFQQKALTEQARLSENAAIDSEYKAIRALQIAEDRAKTIRQNLYVAEMNLAGNASADGGGLAEVLLITDRWQSRSQPEDFRGWEWYYLRATTARELSQHIHPGYVGEYKFSPNGNRVANVSLDNRIRIWPSDFSSDPLKIGPFSVHLRSIAWDSSGGIVVCGGVEGFLKSFDAVTGKELLDYKDAKNFELNKSVVRSNHGDRFASASKNKVTIWNWKSPKPIDSHHIKEIGTIDAFAWSQDDRAIVLASPRKILRLNVETGIVDWQTSATKGMRFERTLSLNFDSTLIAVAGTDQKVHILDAESGEYLHHLSGHNGSIPMVAWSPEGRLLASASGYSIRLWDPDEAFSSRVLGEHLHSVERIAWSPDGNRIISSDEQHRIKIWPIYKQANLRTIKVSNQWVSDLCWNPEGTRLASATITGNVSIWDFESGEHLRTMIEDRDRVMSVNWSTDGKWLTSTGWSGGVNLWNMENDLAHPKLQGLAGRGLDCEISADGKTILGRAWDNMVLWEREAGKIRFSVPLPNVSNSGTSASLSPDSSLIATADSRSIGIWETETGRKIQRIPYDGQSPKTTIFKGVSWHPNGKIILAAAKDNIARIWDVNSGELLQTLSGHGGWVTAGVWNPDGSRVATASYDGICRIWNPVTGDLLLTLITGHGVVQAVRWHPDGRSLATCGTDGTIKIWDARKGYEMKEAKEQ